MTSKGYSMEFHGALESPNKKSPIQWDSIELGGRHFKWHKCSIEYSMEFRWNLVLPNEIWLCSMDFQGIWNCHFMACFPGLPMDIPCNSMELWSRQIKKSPSFMWFHGIRSAPCQMTQVFHGIFHGIPWNSCAAKWNITQFHGIPFNIPWNSMELWCRQMKYHLVPWNSMELWDCHFMTCYPGLPRDIPWNSMELWSRQIKKSPSSMGLHGIRRAPFQMTQVFHGIFHGIPSNFGAAKWNMT